MSTIAKTGLLLFTRIILAAASINQQQRLTTIQTFNSPSGIHPFAA
jgi:hypothetical protein